VEQLLLVSSRARAKRSCTFCAPETGWLTVEAAAEATGWPPLSLLRLAQSSELHFRYGPDGVFLICAISLSLKVLKGDKENET